MKKCFPALASVLLAMPMGSCGSDAVKEPQISRVEWGDRESQFGAASGTVNDAYLRSICENFEDKLVTFEKFEDEDSDMFSSNAVLDIRGFRALVHISGNEPYTFYKNLEVTVDPQVMDRTYRESISKKSNFAITVVLGDFRSHKHLFFSSHSLNNSNPVGTHFLQGGRYSENLYGGQRLKKKIESKNAQILSAILFMTVGLDYDFPSNLDRELVPAGLEYSHLATLNDRYGTMISEIGLPFDSMDWYIPRHKALSANADFTRLPLLGDPKTTEVSHKGDTLLIRMRVVGQSSDAASSLFVLSAIDFGKKFNGYTYCNYPRGV